GNDFRIELWTVENKVSYEIGEVIRFRFKTNRDCNVTIYAVSPGGKASRLFPNQWQPEGQVRAGRVYSIPPADGDFRFRVHGPEGTEVVKAIATMTPDESEPDAGTDEEKRWTEAQFVFRIVKPGAAATDRREPSSEELESAARREQRPTTARRPESEQQSQAMAVRHPEQAKPAVPADAQAGSTPAIQAPGAELPKPPAEKPSPTGSLPDPEEHRVEAQQPQSEEGRIAVEPTETEETQPSKPAEMIARSERTRHEESRPEAAPPLPEKKFTALALSLRVLQDKLRECRQPDKCPDELLRLGGMTRVLGYVVDEANQDLILVGQVDQSMPQLHLGDFVVAMRNTWNGSEPPGCSIDPDPEVVNELQGITSGENVNPASQKFKESVKKWKEVCSRPQKTRIMGVDPDTRFAHVMIDADYYMKRLVNGSVDLEIDGFKSLSHMTLDLAGRQIEENGAISIPAFVFNRFWFSPGEYSFVEDGTSAWIRDGGVILLTEEEFLTKSGQIVGSGKPNHLAEKFTEAFSKSYPEIAKKKPIYSELESLFRFVALARVMNLKRAAEASGVQLDYLLSEYPVNAVPVSETLPGLSNVNELKHRKRNMEYYFCLKNCGGVSMDIPMNDKVFVPAKQEVSSAIAKDVISARPASDTFFWKVVTRSPEELSPKKENGR
ncbi:MAG: DUF4384 domain-containing protein, partial [Deltaproteobacteria bacterium]|nr:DUF4384 domain-containing protein [Deltaproteobacteria bacterium]